MSSSTAISLLAKSGARIPPLPTIRDLVGLYKLRAIKQLLQNFLMDERLTNKIVRAAGNIQNNYVLEVGPGPGGITRSIIKMCPHLVAVEKDRCFLPTLELLPEASKDFLRMDIVRKDILEYHMAAPFSDCSNMDWQDKRAPVHILGNLPLAISTRLLVNWPREMSLQTGAWSLPLAISTRLLVNWPREMSLQTGAWSYGRSSLINISEGNYRAHSCSNSGKDTLPHLGGESNKLLIPDKALVPKPDVVGGINIIPLKTLFPLLISMFWGKLFVIFRRVKNSAVEVSQTFTHLMCENSRSFFQLSTEE
ncbi:dimethyladenosine transferase 1, mitochondrial isoform X1 [Topomyia yanbarensis]|uniref:dimethyladenosine transferase 1, mitochondrial isoform X1 n=1 Tax=Topomyia yanbarensis TaxID=2498891 RepID=UPI00273C06C6|nr:dimethyladenosine transferase 1, mitochondrial isoform X1 [Topomyia yanbarensis]